MTDEHEKIYLGVLLCLLLAYLMHIYMEANRWEGFSLGGTEQQCVDGQCYKMISGAQGTMKDRVRMMDRVNKFSLQFMRHMRNKYIWGSYSATHPRRRMAELLTRRYRPDRLMENMPREHGVNTSFVASKGEKFAVCLVDAGQHGNPVVEWHHMQFVILHELSHLMCVEYGHGPGFWSTFKATLQEAQEAGLHRPQNYAQQPYTYCGLLLNHSPFFDSSIIAR